MKATIAVLGIHISVVDGSGLSRSDRTSPDQVATLLTDYVASPLYGVLHDALARPAQTGTLIDRMNGSAAVGRCVAKTGTLDFVSNLAGWCRAVGGHTIAFALLMDGIDVTAAHALQDAMTEAIARYDDGTPAGTPAPPPPLLAAVTAPSGPTAPIPPVGTTGPPARPARPPRRERRLERPRPERRRDERRRGHRRNVRLTGGPRLLVDELAQGGLVDDGHPEALGLLELGSRALPGDE